LYLVVYPGGAILATSLEVALGFFEGVHGKTMRAKAQPEGYVYEVYPDFPGPGWSLAERAIANLGKQRPEGAPPLPVFPFRVCEEWGSDD